MNDTSSHIKQKQIEIILSKTNQQRFEMGVSMMQAGYDLTKERIQKMYPEASKNERSFLIFEAMYGKEFSEDEISKIRNHFSSI